MWQDVDIWVKHGVAGAMRLAGFLLAFVCFHDVVVLWCSPEECRRYLSLDVQHPFWVVFILVSFVWLIFRFLAHRCLCMIQASPNPVLSCAEL